MKRFLIASSVAVLAFAVVASAQGYNFSANLTVGSTGPDVVALQTWLIANGFNIPAISAGTAKGYFGSQTKAAVVKYQASVGLPNTGFVGPLTRGKLNGGASTACPAGLVCTPVSTTVACPAGYICTPTNGTPVVGGPTGIMTPGIPGTLAVTLQSNYNGVTLDKGKTESVARIKLQANASDMQVTSLSLDFSQRLWLYVGTLTVTDDSGAVVASKALSAADFAELTVGNDYRMTLPLNYIVGHAQIKYLTVALSALATSDRDAGTIAITSGQVRSIDGTGVTDTQDIAGTFPRNISYSGSGNADIITTIDPSSPSAKLVQISTSVETDNVLLAVYSIKSENADTMLRTLKIYVHTDPAGDNINTTFNEIKLKIGGATFSADTIRTTTPDTNSSSTVTFNNIDTRLPADQYVTISVLGKVAKNVSATASTTLYANGTNIVAEDASYTAVTVNNNGGISSEAQSFTASGVIATSASVSYGTKTVENSGSTTQQFTFTASLTAGSNPIYLSKTVGTALTTSNSNAGVTVTNIDWSDTNPSGDGTAYFYIAPGQTKTFNAVYNAGATSSGTNTVFQVTSVNAGTSTTGPWDVTLNSPDVQNALKAVLFH